MVPLRQGRQRLLLAVLLLNANEPVSSDRLIDALWGEQPPPSAAGSLYNLVSGVRKALGGGRIVTRDHGYVLRVAGDELDSERFQALAEQGRAALARGRHAAVISELARLTTEHPFRERLRGQQMLALYRAGRQADALAAYRDARERLVEELGVEPGPALRRLEQAVLEHDPALGAPDALPDAPPALA